jgi:alpha-galactosidase
MADVMLCEALDSPDCSLVLVDSDAESLKRAHRIADLIREHRGSRIEIHKTVDRGDALPGADFVILSVARKRYELWEQDFRVPLAFGFKHVLGENGGPGALFHTLRNYQIVMPICRDIEKNCPDAPVLNFTNPESRIVMAIKHLTGLDAVGLCHGVPSTRYEIARILNRSLDELDIVTGGLNHFFWVLDIRDGGTGEDLYPLLRERGMESSPPLASKMLRTFNYYTFPSDDHIGEYLSFASLNEPHLWPYGREKREVVPGEPRTGDWRDAYISGERPVDEDLIKPSGEAAIQIISDIINDADGWQPAVNVPNDGRYIENLPGDAIVEVPATVNARGIHPQTVGTLPEPLAALCRIQVSIQQLIVEAYRHRSRNLLLQALLLDPVVDDIERAERMLDYMLDLQREYLPRFS